MPLNTLLFRPEPSLPLSTQKNREEILVLLDDYWVFKAPGVVLNNQKVLDLDSRDRKELLYAVPKECVLELHNEKLQSQYEYSIGSNYPGPVEISTFNVFVLMAANPNLLEDNKWLFVDHQMIDIFGLLNLPVGEENNRHLIVPIGGGGMPALCILKSDSRAPVYIPAYGESYVRNVQAVFSGFMNRSLTEYEISHLQRTISFYSTIDAAYKELENENADSDFFKAEIYLSTQINEALLVEYARPAPDS